jgi:hypothetical protein
LIAPFAVRRIKAIGDREDSSIVPDICIPDAVRGPEPKEAAPLGSLVGGPELSHLHICRLSAFSELNLRGRRKSTTSKASWKAGSFPIVLPVLLNIFVSNRAEYLRSDW